MSVGKIAILLAVCVASVGAQSNSPVSPAPQSNSATAAGFEDRVRAAMAQSIEKQRASVQRQTASALPVATLPSTGFFTTPWPQPPSFEALGPVVQAACDPMAKEQLDPLVADAATKEGVDAKLVQAVIERESAAKPCAVSVKGAQGLMQLMPSVATDFGVKDPFDPKENIGAGAKLLKQLLNKYNGDVSLALSAYNAGSARVDREGGIPPIPETINYVNAILDKVAPQQP